MEQQRTIRAAAKAAALAALALCFALPAMALCFALPAMAQVASVGDKETGTLNTKPTVLNGVGLSQNLNSQLPLDAAFTDQDGRQVRLGDYFGTKPAVLALVYYQCKLLCSEEMNGMTGALEMVRYKPGKDFNIVVVSIDPTETPAMAAAARDKYFKRYDDASTAGGWHFLVGPESSIDRLSNAVGYKYVKVPGPDGKMSQFAHTSAIEVVTPQGKVAQYFYGVEYSPKDLLFALMQASNGRIGSPVEALVLYCYHYSPTTGHYSLIIARVVQLGCLLTMFTLGGFLIVMFRKDVQRDSNVRRDG